METYGIQFVKIVEEHRSCLSRWFDHVKTEHELFVVKFLGNLFGNHGRCFFAEAILPSVAGWDDKTEPN